MGALALHKQEVRSQADVLHSEHDGRSLSPKGQGQTSATTLKSVLRRSNGRIVRVGLALVAVAAIAVVIAWAVRRRGDGTPTHGGTAPTWPPPFEREGEAAPSEADWVAPDDGGSCPVSHPIKGKLSSQIFHVPGGM